MIRSRLCPLVWQFLLVAVALWGGQIVFAQTQNSYPMLMSVKPVAVQIGQTAEVELSSRYSLLGASRVLVAGDGLTGEALPPAMPPEIKPGQPRPVVPKVKLKFTAAAEAVPGVRDFRVFTPQGVSTVGQLLLTRDVVVPEAAENNTADKAQMAPFPATLCGTIEKAEDVDWFKFRIDAPSTVVFQVWAQRLENRIHDLQVHVDPILTLRSATGATLATADNVVAGDPLLIHRFEQPGEYLLDVRDVRYQGNVDWVYAIEMSARPLVTQFHPAVVAPGVEASLAAVGYNLPADANVKLTLPAETRAGMHFASVPVGGQAVGSAPVLVSGLPVVVEAAMENNTRETAQMVTAPGIVCGKIDVPMDVDHFVFEAKKGEAWTFETLARRLGSPVDTVIRLYNAKGGLHFEQDDCQFERRTIPDSRQENWSCPEDGKYVVEIRDLHSAGGPEYCYSLRIEKAEPGFSVELDTDKTLLAPGLQAPMYVRVVRRNGFVGPVQLGVENLPAGVTAVAGRVLASGNEGIIVFKADAAAPVGVGEIRVFGTGQHTPTGGTPVDLRVEGESLQEIYMPGGGRWHYRVDMPHAVSIADPMDVRSVKLSTTAVNLKPGESQKIEIEVERAPDYKGNVTLDVLFHHLEQPYGVSLPKGVKLDPAGSKTLLTNGETKGFITLKAAMDAEAAEGQLVPVLAHVSINFVMKHTFCGDPLTVTVTPPAK
jgi:hypothetical protein